eukprot:CAMPEP_0206632222 /NCGR_PEP_ID=MMETSP0325_2-20121206/68765_1 /ASSEMBLY_ACC=CAM_ASM_000347 /TAXON_ID=2866 /ORGANISM="Crypthecodinium cohnii, Strain Seligo" /LENGTH=331 /DNA_ID=CAMNT_0054157681 /DNA_START=63 /DNA_END=1055 /DNA_ORIENTATION=+
MTKVTFSCGGLLCIGAIQLALGKREHYSFDVAEVKPHYGCTEPSGQQRVRDFVGQLVSEELSIITLLQVEFEMDHPEGYFAIGGACAGSQHEDVAVALVREEEFSFAAPLGATQHGWYNMPYLSGKLAQQPPDPARSMCISNIKVVGERPYAGAILTHKASGVSLCLVIGTLPHPSAFPKSFTMDFVDAVQSCAQDRPLLLVVDSNLVYGQTVAETFSEQGLDLQHDCSDPGAFGAPTCCNDSLMGHPESRYQSDRTVLCGGRGAVKDFTVKKDYICNAPEEHLTTRATVKLTEAVPNKHTEDENSPSMRVPFPHIYGFSASIFCLAWCYW